MIYQLGGLVTVTSSNMTGNRAVTHAGTLYMVNGFATFSDTLLQNNTSVNPELSSGQAANVRSPASISRP